MTSDGSGETTRLLPVIVYGVHWIDETSGEGHEEFDSQEFRDDPSDAERRTYVDMAEVREAIAWMGPCGQRAILERLALHAPTKAAEDA